MRSSRRGNDVTSVRRLGLGTVCGTKHGTAADRETAGAGTETGRMNREEQPAGE
ncbi:MAG: hypothetical protein HFI35_00450 [Roseburia sp.]|nr:hypothetical protein [Roseburia sp.]